MTRLGSCVLAVMVLTSGTASTAEVTYGDWEETGKGNFIRKCSFEGGGHQYLVLLKAQPEWVYWFNPTTKVYWCRCPTKRHPDFGKAVADGADLFLLAIVKGETLDKTTFPPDARRAFKKGATAKDANGKPVDLTCPPNDLPPGV